MSKHRAPELGVSLARVRNDTVVCGTRAERMSREVLEAGLRDVMTVGASVAKAFWVFASVK